MSYSELPPGAIGVYSYIERMTTGLKHMMNGLMQKLQENLAKSSGN